MSIAHSSHDVMAPTVLISASQEAVREVVWNLLTHSQVRGPAQERRLHQRFPYAELVTILPAGSDGTPLEAEPMTVVAKQLSERGMGFFHSEPIPYRRVVVTFESPDGEAVSLLTDLNWCRFIRRGWYESGGRFLYRV